MTRIVQLIATLFVSCVCIAVGGCATPQGTAAAVATGALLGAGTVVELATGSYLEVTVEIYDSKGQDDDNFQMSRSIAARRALTGINDPVLNPDLATLTTIDAALETPMNVLRRKADVLESSAKDVQKHLVGKPDGEAIHDDFMAQAQAVRAILDAYQRFSKAVDDAGAHKTTDLTVAAQHLARLRSQLDLATNLKLSPQYLMQLHREMLNAVYDDLFKAYRERLNQLNQLKEEKGQALQKAIDPKNVPPIIDIIDEIRQLLLKLPVGFDAVNTNARFMAFGIALTSDQLTAVISRQQLGALLPEAVATLAVRRSAQSAKAITFGGITTGANIGPITNEVMQIVLSRGKDLALIAGEENECRWKRLNFCRSEAGLGNHDTIIYFENMGTPIIKSSAFDPTKFIVAHGALYRRAFGAIADVLGAPMGTGGADSLSDLNIPSAAARAKNSTDEAEQSRQAVLKTMRAILDEQKKVKAAQATAKEVKELLAPGSTAPKTPTTTPTLPTTNPTTKPTTSTGPSTTRSSGGSP